MAQEILNSIKDAETKAQQTIVDAQAKSKTIIETAKKEVEEYENDILNKAKAKAKEAVDEAASGKDEAIEAARRRALSVITQNQNNLDEKRNQAIDVVIAEITG